MDHIHTVLGSVCDNTGSQCCELYPKRYGVRLSQILVGCFGDINPSDLFSNPFGFGGDSIDFGVANSVYIGASYRGLGIGCFGYSRMVERVQTRLGYTAKWAFDLFQSTRDRDDQCKISRGISGGVFAICAG